VAIGCVLGHCCAGNVYMRTATFFECRAHHLDGLAPLVCVTAWLCVLHATNVISIGDPDIANATENVASHVAVPACCLAAQVVLHITQPVFCSFQPIVSNHRGDQG